jgi:hypothetical protein
VSGRGHRWRPASRRGLPCGCERASADESPLVAYGMGPASRADRPRRLHPVPPGRLAADQRPRPGGLADLDSGIQRPARRPGRPASSLGRAEPGRTAARRHGRGTRGGGGSRRVAFRGGPLDPARRHRGRHGRMAIRSRARDGDVSRPRRRGGGHGPGHDRRLPASGQRDPPDLAGVHPGRPARPAGPGQPRPAAAVRLSGVLRGHGRRGADRRRPRRAGGAGAGRAGSASPDSAGHGSAGPGPPGTRPAPPAARPGACPAGSAASLPGRPVGHLRRKPARAG